MRFVLAERGVAASVTDKTDEPDFVGVVSSLRAEKIALEGSRRFFEERCMAEAAWAAL